MLNEKININSPCESVSFHCELGNKSLLMGVFCLIVMYMRNTSGVYKIQSILNPEKFYIGSSQNIGRRFTEHKHHLLRNTHYNIKLQRYVNKHGIENLVFLIIEPCLPDFLLIREQFYIDTLNPFFNINPNAESCLGCKRSDESKEKYKIAAKNQQRTLEWNKNISKANKGKTPWNKGSEWGQEVKDNISMGKTGLPLPLRIIKEKSPRRYVIQYDLNFKYINSWRTASEASRQTGLRRKTISERCNLKSEKPYKGFYFRYEIR